MLIKLLLSNFLKGDPKRVVTENTRMPVLSSHVLPHFLIVAKS